jgi:hypothetical protein
MAFFLDASYCRHGSQAQAFMVWFQGPDVGFADFLKVIMIVYMSTMLGLFGNFFVQNYMKPKPKSKKATN